MTKCTKCKKKEAIYYVERQTKVFRISDDEMIDDGTPDEITARLCKKCGQKYGIEDIEYEEMKI